MRKRTDTPTGPSAGVVGLVVLLLAGCSYPSPDTADAASATQSVEKTAATQPADTPRPPETATTQPSPPSLPPLPEKATTSWEKLEPAVGKLKNTEPRKLPAPAQRALAEGEEALKDNNIPRAIDRLVRAKGFDRQHPVILRRLAEAYARLPNWGKAIENYEAVAKVSPNDLDLQVALGDALREQKQTDKALTAYRTALKTDAADPNNPLAAHALLQAARILEDNDRWQAALDAYTRLGEWLMEHGTTHARRDALKEWVTNPERLLKKRGLLLGKLRQHEEAARLLSRAHRRDRSDQQTVVVLLEALRSSKQFDRVEKLLVDLLTERTQRAYAMSLAQSVCVASGDANMPMRLWTAAADRRFDREAGIALARAAEKLDNTDDAAEILSEILKQDPTSTA
ncbi:MAG: tetratricopeptide repeat protein, partial [Phycisphaerae bacterium]